MSDDIYSLHSRTYMAFILLSGFPLNPNILHVFIVFELMGHGHISQHNNSTSFCLKGIYYFHYFLFILLYDGPKYSQYYYWKDKQEWKRILRYFICYWSFLEIYEWPRIYIESSYIWWIVVVNYICKLVDPKQCQKHMLIFSKFVGRFRGRYLNSKHDSRKLGDTVIPVSRFRGHVFWPGQGIRRANGHYSFQLKDYV